MRTIKFRAKRKDTQEWVYGWFVGYSGEMSYIFGDYVDKDEVWQVDTKTVGQFTGLLDKNGVEIYEGDYVQYFNGTHAYIVFLQGGFVVVGEGFRNEFIGHALGKIEVIGNIHE